MNKRIISGILAAAGLATILSGCASDAKNASYNISKAADQFEVQRSTIFYNGITGEIMLSIEGRCSIENQGSQLEVTCKIADNEYTKDFLGLSDNVTYFSHQLAPIDVSVYHQTVIIKPENFLPGFQFEAGEQ